MTTPGSEIQAGDLAIIAALPRELAGLARALDAKTVFDKDGVRLQQGVAGPDLRPVLLATAGMGPDRVTLAVSAASAHRGVGALLSVGLAGACDPGLLPGCIVSVRTVIDTRSGERFETDLQFGVELDGAAGVREMSSASMAVGGILVTSPQIAGVEEKRRLYESYGAAAVDMEAATVARLARAHGIPFGALKAISDEHDVDVSHLSSFTNSRGHFRTGAFALQTAVRPRQWRSTMQLGRSSKMALNHLTSAIQGAISTLTSAS